MCDPASSVVAEAELSAAPPGRTARLVLDLGYADAQVAAVARALGEGMLSQIETLLADPAAEARNALAALADALAGQMSGGATVTALDTPLARAWRAHPAGRGR